MSRPANQASGSGSTGGSSTKPKRFAWGGGKPVHSKSEAAHDKGLATKLAARRAQPAPVDPLYQSAQLQAAAMYQPQSDALDTLTRSTPQWFENYKTDAVKSAAASAAAAQPLIDRQRAFAGNVNAPAAGLDPNSPEYAKSQQAGQGLSALATFGADNTAGNAAADQTYFAGQQANAARDLPQVLAELLHQKGALGTEQAGKALEIYQQLHAQAATEHAQSVNEDIARQTLGANISNQNFDNTLAAGYDPVTGKKLPAKPPSASEQRSAADLAFFEKNGYYPPTGPPAATKPGGLTPAQQASKDAKAAAALDKRRTSSHKAASRVTDAEGRLNTYAKRKIKTGQTVKNKDGTTTEVTRAAKPEDVVNMLLADDFTADEIALARTLNAGKRLTAAQIELAHQLGITHVPSKWRPQKVKRPNIATGTGNPASATGTGLG